MELNGDLNVLGTITQAGSPVGGTDTEARADIDVLIQENAVQEMAILENTANSAITPIDHNTLESETYSGSGGYNNTVDTGSTTMAHNSIDKRYEFSTGGAEIIEDFDRTPGATVGNGWTEVQDSSGDVVEITADSNSSNGNELHVQQNASGYNGDDEATAYKDFTQQSTYDYTLHIKKNYISGAVGNSTVFGVQCTSVDSSGGVRIAGNAIGDSFTVYDSSTTQIGPTFTITDNTWAWWRVSYDGTNLKWKRWTGVLGDEPGAWDYDAVNSNKGGGGYTVFRLVRSGAGRNCEIFVDAIYDNTAGTSTGFQKVQHDLPTETGSITHVQAVANEQLGSPDSSHMDFYDSVGSSIGSVELNTKTDVSSLNGNPTRMDYVIVRPNETDDEAWVKTWTLKYWKA